MPDISDLNFIKRDFKKQSISSLLSKNLIYIIKGFVFSACDTDKIRCNEKNIVKLLRRFPNLTSISGLWTIDDAKQPENSLAQYCRNTPQPSRTEIIIYLDHNNLYCNTINQYFHESVLVRFLLSGSLFTFVIPHSATRYRNNKNAMATFDFCTQFHMNLSNTADCCYYNKILGADYCYYNKILGNAQQIYDQKRMCSEYWDARSRVIIYADTDIAQTGKKLDPKKYYLLREVEAYFIVANLSLKD
jgi:hypothetical protein